MAIFLRTRTIVVLLIKPFIFQLKFSLTAYSVRAGWQERKTANLSRLTSQERVRSLDCIIWDEISMSSKLISLKLYRTALSREGVCVVCCGPKVSRGFPLSGTF